MARRCRTAKGRFRSCSAGGGGSRRGRRRKGRCLKRRGGRCVRRAKKR